MDKALKFTGTWFLPNKNEDEYAGSFFYTRSEGCYLEIIGGFEEVFDSFKEDIRYEIVLGITVDGKEITLVGCERGSQKSNLNGVTVSKYYVNYAFIGNHYDSLDNIKFDTFKASICDLEDWVRIYGFNKLSIDFIERKIDLQYQLPDDRFFTLSDSLKAYFEFKCTFPTYKNTSKAEINQSTFIGLKTKNIIPFKQMLNNFFRLYKFISIAYYDSPHILGLYLNNSTIPNANGKNKDFVEVLYSDNYYNESYKVGERLNKYLFTYKDVEDNFPSILKSWFELYEKASSAINLLIELLLKRRFPLELEFLTAIQAVETFHRNIFGGEDLSKDEHEIRIKAILESAPEQYHVWLKEKLEHSNELRLRKRLKILYDSIPVQVSKRLIKDRKGFINEVVNSRNYYTHYDKKQKSKVMSNNEILKAVEKLKALLLCSILNELQLSKDQIISFVKLEKVYRYGD